ncbi:outer membrane protein [Brucella gallinifaecis]|uniref:Porin family protein n=1 Tax=Brucella gallinifaecis TaxID=215590 RepID=A0A502BPA4_9HYPH|nr:outer membrane protein [Brucella gallinifaecis]TPF74903.1 porin family protein [Brucella gallinifaecis]
MNSLIKNLCASLALSAALAVFTSAALAADDLEVVPEVVVAPMVTSGWYLRGDIGYSWNRFRRADFELPDLNGNRFDGDLNGSFVLGGGIGYQITDYLRTDLTLDYLTRAKFTTDYDESRMSGLSVLANAYVDLANFGGVTPYIGAGLGATRVKWDDMAVAANGHELSGQADWRFTYALMAGASVELTHNLKLDASYRFRHMNGGTMLEGGSDIGAVSDKGINAHDIRVGLRYMFGG